MKGIDKLEGGGLLEKWRRDVEKGCGGGLDYLEGNGTELMVSEIKNYLCGFSINL